jgi:hypothetical protein
MKYRIKEMQTGHGITYFAIQERFDWFPIWLYAYAGRTYSLYEAQNVLKILKDRRLNKKSICVKIHHDI